MFAAIGRTDHLGFFGGIPPRDPAARAVEERKGRRTVKAPGMLSSLVQLFPSTPTVRRMHDDIVAQSLSRARKITANGPSFVAAYKLNSSEIRGDFAGNALTCGPGKREWNGGHGFRLPVYNPR